MCPIWLVVSQVMGVSSCRAITSLRQAASAIFFTLSIGRMPAPGAQDQRRCPSNPFHRTRPASKKGTWSLLPQGARERGGSLCWTVSSACGGFLIQMVSGILRTMSRTTCAQRGVSTCRSFRRSSVKIERPARRGRNCTSQRRTGRYCPLHLRTRDIRQSCTRYR